MEDRAKIKEETSKISKISKISKASKKTILIVIAALLVVATIAGRILLFRHTAGQLQDTREVITTSALEKIIDVSELSTFTAVYNGVASVMNDKKPTEIDYYVAYNATVDTGIDFGKLDIQVDNDANVIHIKIPEVYIIDVNVDIASLDFIFYNNDANTSTVSEEAFKACEEDVRQESEKQEAIFTLAKQNAMNVLTALTKPIVEQLDAEYTLVIE